MANLTVAIAGNPNSGKTSLFNVLTGSRHRVGNFPGVTVDRLSANLSLGDGLVVRLIDLPGTYSFFPNSLDERIATEVLVNTQHPDHPDLVIYVADANQLDRQLLGFSQLVDLGISCILVLSMIDEFHKAGHQLDVDTLRSKWGVPVMVASSRTGEKIDELKSLIATQVASLPKPASGFQVPDHVSEIEVPGREGLADQPFRKWLWMHHYEWLIKDVRHQGKLHQALHAVGFEPIKEQINETFRRLDELQTLVHRAIKRSPESIKWTDRVDRILTGRMTGPLIFIVLMLLVFQAIFAWATYPMDWIEAGIGYLSYSVSTYAPAGWFTDLLTEGVLAGIAGVLVFVPQIAILFLLISILEEVGYMARAVYLFDRLLQRFGMNGRSIVALISGGACAIPAIMSTRTITNWKERLITILVTPFISCSARIPVYTVLVALVVPYDSVLGLFNTQGLAFAGLYLLGIVTALGAGWILKKILKSDTASMLMMEMPDYRAPDWRTVWRTVLSKVGTFIKEAGQIILIISVVLWFLASYGIPSQMEAATELAQQEAQEQGLSEQDAQNLLSARKMEASFAGALGKLIEPIIQPLGYDWKIGIALLSSFAAREVFIGSLATLYSVGSEEDEFRIRAHLAKQRDPLTGARIFNYATAFSLLIFFVFAMQCMSTLAVVKAETQSWKWPILQFIAMTLIAYLGALLVFQWLGS